MEETETFRITEEFRAGNAHLVYKNTGLRPEVGDVVNPDDLEEKGQTIQPED